MTDDAHTMKPDRLQQAIDQTMANLPEHLAHIKTDLSAYCRAALMRFIQDHDMVSGDMLASEQALLRRCLERCHELEIRLERLEQKNPKR